jgi:hypothetical protein
MVKKRAFSRAVKGKGSFAAVFTYIIQSLFHFQEVVCIVLGRWCVVRDLHYCSTAAVGWGRGTFLNENISC